jgi:hypothetical protein
MNINPFDKISANMVFDKMAIIKIVSDSFLSINAPFEIILKKRTLSYSSC